MCHQCPKEQNLRQRRLPLNISIDKVFLDLAIPRPSTCHIPSILPEGGGPVDTWLFWDKRLHQAVLVPTDNKARSLLTCHQSERLLEVVEQNLGKLKGEELKSV